VAQTVPVKTPEAVTELGSRQRKLSQRHRTVLLLVDGKRSELQVRQMALQAGAAGTCFDELVELGMIALTGVEAEAPVSAPMPLADTPSPAPLRAFDLPPAGPDSVASSLLPPSLTLQPESVLNDSVLNEPPPSDLGGLDTLIREAGDAPLEEARDLMIRAVRAEAPVAGTLTLLRLRRAASRADLEVLLEEVELRITKPFKGLWASQTMSRVRELLSTQSVT
jgi:hypothetical protein